MDARTRWETEALRGGTPPRVRPPQPAKKRRAEDRDWVTLREAETATGIPSNTLRKWVRKSDLPSYLESDGDLVLRMVDLNAVKARAKELGRDDEPLSVVRHRPSDDADATDTVIEDTPPTADSRQPTAPTSDPAWAPEDETAPAPEGTMLVPVDAWNKMLEQLGNLHEAGQQLAEARERAAKAETEAEFLRERLSEMRGTIPERESQAGEPLPPTQDEDAHRPPPTADRPEADPAAGPAHSEPSTVDRRPSTDTTSYWRYLTTGWRDRKKRTRG